MNYKHDVQYEFGSAFYWNIAVTGWMFVHASLFYFTNPYNFNRSSSRTSDEDAELVNYL